MAFVRDGDLPYRRLIVNEHIVDEAATRLKKRASMRNAAGFMSTLTASQVYRLEVVSDDAFEAAMERFVEWTDLEASFTDFVVVAQMDAMGISHIATFDTHYEAFDVIGSGVRTGLISMLRPLAFSP